PLEGPTKHVHDPVSDPEKQDDEKTEQGTHEPPAERRLEKRGSKRQMSRLRRTLPPGEVVGKEDDVDGHAAPPEPVPPFLAWKKGFADLAYAAEPKDLAGKEDQDNGARDKEYDQGFRPDHVKGQEDEVGEHRCHGHAPSRLLTRDELPLGLGSRQSREHPFGKKEEQRNA